MAKKVPGLHVHSLMIGDNVVQVICNSIIVNTDVVTFVIIALLLLMVTN